MENCVTPCLDKFQSIIRSCIVFGQSRIINELHDMKSDSCHVIKWYMLLVKYIYSCSTMTSLVTANITWRKPMTPGDFWKFEHKGAEKQIKEPVCLMSVFCHENKCLFEVKQCLLNVVQYK